MENEILFSLPLPTSEEFDSMSDLLSYCNHFAKNNGYAVSTKYSHPERNIGIKCDFGGVHRQVVEEQDIKRQTASRLINCPFLIYGRKYRDGKWRFEIKNSFHNHPPTPAISHPVHRRLLEGQIKEVEHLTYSGCKPKNILLSLLQKDNSDNLTSQAIYNAKQKTRLQNLNGLSPLQKLFQDLHRSDWEWDYSLGDDNSVISLFLAHPDSIKLGRSFNKAFVVDCTYNTTKHKFNQLGVVGITSLNTTFYLCMAFIPKETEEWYTWALIRMKNLFLNIELPLSMSIDRDLALFNSILCVFPNSKIIICTWHIYGNIVKNAKAKLDGECLNVLLQMWNELISSKTENEFDINWGQIVSYFGENHQLVLYLENTWIPLKEHFVSFWINKVQHLGGHVTSRVEGSHSVLKSYLDNSLGNMLAVKVSFGNAVTKQLREYQAQSAMEQTRSLIALNTDFFVEVTKKISYYALKLIKKQYDKALLHTSELECSRYNRIVMGWPCSHDILELINSGERLRLEHVSTQWHLIRPNVAEMVSHDLYAHVREPGVFRVRGRPQGSIRVLNQTTSQQENIGLVSQALTLNQADIMSSRGRPTGSRGRCRICGETDHNSRTCSAREIN